MRYKRFEDLPVWNTAIELAIGVYSLTSNPEFDKRYSLKDQLERSSVSVSNNIAEGFERGTIMNCSRSFTSRAALPAKRGRCYACSNAYLVSLGYAARSKS